MKLKLSACAIAVAALISAPAISSAAPMFELVFGANSTSSNDPLTGAAGTVGFTFADDISGDVLVTLDIENTTGDTTFGDGATSSKLTGFGFDLDPAFGATFNGVVSAGSFLDTHIANAAFNPFGTLDVAFADNTNFLGGNANGALPENDTDTISFLLSSSKNAADLGADFQAAFFDE